MVARKALGKAGHPEILGIGFSGQMHGLVLLDQSKRVLQPAIIWADQRSSGLLSEIEGRVGRSLLAQRCGTAPTAGFAIASLYSLQKFEAVPTRDAASTGLFDVGQRIWADEVIGRLGLPRSIFPKVHVSADVVGPLNPSADGDRQKHWNSARQH